MKQIYADVIVDISISKLDKSFQYKIPEELLGSLKEGSKVKVPFGNGNRLIDGYVISFGTVPKCDEKLIKYIDSLPEASLSVEDKLIELAAWIRNTYGSTFISALKTVLPVKKKRKRKPKAETEIEESSSPFCPLPFTLDKQQKAAYDGIKKEFNSKTPRPCLLKGVTGSGKTHIYIRLIEDVLSTGGQAILLIPEISLSWQTLSRLYSRFGNKAAVLHSRLSDGEKADVVERIKSGTVSLVVGPRSALFAPFSKLKLIIIDEEHDLSYQSDKTPRYHARETAQKRAQIENAALLLGSATPSLESRYRCDTGEYALFNLEERYAGAHMPKMHIVDMRKELKNGNRSVLSRVLKEEIAKRLKNHEQVILFLNKRGHTGFFTCRSCGYVLKCPHCDIALTYHNNGLIMCHYCGYSHAMPKTCPDCGSSYIGGYKAGTQQAEELVKKAFPEAKVIRMDRDTTTKKNSHEKILSTFAGGDADILVGTQMIAKGHDFPRVTLVGILFADSALYTGDFRASERAFDLIVQASGRAGRGENAGCALIQTYYPGHYAIRTAAAQDYEAFYKEEISARALMRYPPVGSLSSIHGSSANEQKLENAMYHLKKYIESISKATILGPSAEVVKKLRDKYRIALYIKSENTAELIRIRQYAEKYIAINKGFDETEIQFYLNN